MNLRRRGSRRGWALTAVLATSVGLTACSAGDRGADPPSPPSSESTSPATTRPSPAPVPQWGPAEELSDEHLERDSPHGLVEVHGRMAMAAWATDDDHVMVAVRNEQGAWSDARSIGRGSPLHLALNGRGSAVIVYGKGRHGQALWARHWVKGGWSPAQGLGRMESSASAVVDRRNVVTVAWTTPHGVAVVRHLPRRGWSSVERLGRTPFSYFERLDMDVNRHGDVVIAWPVSRGQQVATKLIARRWRISEPISGGGFYPDPSVEVDDQGRGLLMWGRWSEAENDGRRHVAYSTSQDGLHWRSAAYVDVRAPGDKVWGTDSLAVSDYRGGRAAATWSTWEGGGGNRLDVSRFAVGEGWEGETRVRGAAGTAYAAISLTTKGTVVGVDSPWGNRLFWGFEQPAEAWQSHKIKLAGLTMASAVDAHRAAVLYHSTSGVYVRTLEIPTDW